tara:strand:+ start:648 stop:1262 length:615 start_codon:yes stop_codon:yes gene_type:complete
MFVLIGSLENYRPRAKMAEEIRIPVYIPTPQAIAGTNHIVYPPEWSKKMKLNPTEQLVAQMLAKKRQKDNREYGNVNSKAGPQSSEFTEIQGVGGELAAAKKLNVYPDFNDGPGKYDLLWAGKTVEVKTTSYPNGGLEVPQKNVFFVPADIYVLVIGTFPEYKVVGGAWGSKIIQETNLLTRPEYDSTVYRLDQDQLDPLERFV